MRVRNGVVILFCILCLCACGAENKEDGAESILQTPEPVKQEENVQSPAPIEAAPTMQPEGLTEEIQRIKEMCFQVVLEGWGGVQFVPYLTEDKGVEYMLCRQGEEPYILPDAWDGDATFVQIREVAFEDYDGDGSTDIITICQYADKYEDEIYDVTVVYFQKEECFEIDPLHYEYLQKNHITDSILEVMDNREKYYAYAASMNGYQSREAQIQVFIREKTTWLLNYDYVNDWERFTIKDLDENGRLELIVSHHGGTGHYTYNHFYEINETYDGLVEWNLNISEEQSQPDLLLAEEIPIYTDEQGLTHYLVEDYIRDVSEYDYTLYDMTVQDGVVEWTLMCNTHESYAEPSTEVPVRTYTNGEGEEITGEDIDAIIEAVWSGETTLLWNWQSKKGLQDVSDIQLRWILQENAQLSKK